MVSKRWQRTQNLILHIALAILVGFPIFLFEFNYPNWVKVTITALGYLILIPFFRWLHRKYAKTFIKVFRCDFEVAARIVQRALNAERLPFTKRNNGDHVVFQIRPGKIELVVADFLLNMPIDDHLIPEVAAKITLHPETSENAMQMQKIRLSLDAVFAMQGW